MLTRILMLTRVLILARDRMLMHGCTSHHWRFLRARLPISQTGFFSLGQPFPPVRNWIWQAAVPGYAQAITSLYESTLFGGKMLSLSVGAGGRPAVVRKHSTKPLYVIALALERNSNINGNCKPAANVTVRVPGTTDTGGGGAVDTAPWVISLEARLQGSVYLVDRTSPMAPTVVQLDGWHDHRHPSYWPEEVTIEAELVDLMSKVSSNGGMLARVQTERSGGRFESFVTLDANRARLDLADVAAVADVAAQIAVGQARGTVVHGWVRARATHGGASPGSIVLLDEDHRGEDRRGEDFHGEDRRDENQRDAARAGPPLAAKWQWANLGRLVTGDHGGLAVHLRAVGAAVDVDKIVLSANAKYLPT
jgi:hypothetical protein